MRSIVIIIIFLFVFHGCPIYAMEPPPGLPPIEVTMIKSFPSFERIKQDHNRLSPISCNKKRRRLRRIIKQHSQSTLPVVKKKPNLKRSLSISGPSGSTFKPFSPRNNGSPSITTHPYYFHYYSIADETINALQLVAAAVKDDIQYIRLALQRKDILPKADSACSMYKDFQRNNSNPRGLLATDSWRELVLFISMHRTIEYRSHKDIVRPTKTGGVMLHYLASRGYYDLLEALISYYKKRGFSLNPIDQNGNTPLLMATHGKHDQVVELLCHSGAKPHLANNAGTSPYSLALSNYNVSKAQCKQLGSPPAGGIIPLSPSRLLTHSSASLSNGGIGFRLVFFYLDEQVFGDILTTFRTYNHGDSQ